MTWHVRNARTDVLFHALILGHVILIHAILVHVGV